MAEAGSAEASEEVGAQRRGRGRLVKLLLGVSAGVAIGMAFVRVSTGNGSVLSDRELQLYGQHERRACAVGKCNCDWVNDQTCAPTAKSGDCCWSCCCAPKNFHPGPNNSMSPLPQQHAIYHNIPSEEPGACGLEYGQGVHVTGSSGDVYHGQVVAQSGSGLFQVAICVKTYTVHWTSIAECGPWWSSFWGFWVPLLLFVLLVIAVAGASPMRGRRARAPRWPERGEHGVACLEVSAAFRCHPQREQRASAGQGVFVCDIAGVWLPDVQTARRLLLLRLSRSGSARAMLVGPVACRDQEPNSDGSPCPSSASCS